MMTEISIDSVDQLLQLVNGLPNNFIYRGQADASWQLQSSLERLIGTDWSSEKAQKFEELSLIRFRSKFHLYDRENIEPKSKLGWLSLMQHHGVPTRLLDFTESPYIALYFALETYSSRMRSDLALYAIDYTAVLEASIEYIQQKDLSFKDNRQSSFEKQDQVFDDVIDRFAYDIAWIAEPGLFNSRLDKQSGSFLISGNRSMRIESVLDQSIYANVEMNKYIIPASLYTGIFALLRKMNITSKSLYGDLDGLARAIRMEMNAYSA